MAKALVDLSDDEDRIVETYKIVHGISRKDEAIRQMIRCFAEDVIQDLQDYSMYADLPRSVNRINKELSVRADVWQAFEAAYRQWYRRRGKHRRSESYAQLADLAIDSALMGFVAKFKAIGEPAEETTEKCDAT